MARGSRKSWRKTARRSCWWGVAPSGSPFHAIQLAFAHSTQTVFYIMAGVMAFGFLVVFRFLPRGRIETEEELEQARDYSSASTSAAAR